MEPIKFTSSKSPLLAIIFWGAILLMAAVQYYRLAEAEYLLGTLLICLLLLAVQGLLLWIWFGTYYLISGSILHYASGPIKGKIDIHHITRLRPNERLWGGLKPALGLDGIVVDYNRWDKIYLSPANKEAFVQALQQVNPKIEIVKQSSATA